MPSWLSTDYKIRILTYKSEESPPFYSVTGIPNRFDINRTLNFFVFVPVRDYAALTITHYIQTAAPPCLYHNPVTVRFSKHPTCLLIHIMDVQGFFDDRFQQPERDRFIEGPEARRPNELEYRYIEPEDERYLCEH